MADVGDVSGEMQTLMRRLGLGRVHCYPGNEQHPGSVVYLERQLVGPITTMIVYSASGEPRPITDCYTSKHIEGNWYRSHSLFRLPQKLSTAVTAVGVGASGSGWSPVSHPALQDMLDAAGATGLVGRRHGP